MDGFDFDYEDDMEDDEMDFFGDSSIYLNNSFSGGFGKINSFSTTSTNKLMKEEPEPEKYSEEEMEIIEKESINKYSGKHHFSFFSLDSLNKENDIRPSGPLDDMVIEENEYVGFHIGTDPFDCGRRLYNSATVNITPNTINALIGCNGAGKSTIRSMIAEIVDRNHFPCLQYDNQRDGGHNALDAMAFDNNFSGLSFGLTSSEGENICNNVFNFLNPMTALLKGIVKRDERYRQYRDTDHIFLLLDAVDSGFSIDNIINLKEYLNKLIELAKENNKNLYIIVAANSFEFAVDTRSWDVQKSKEEFYTVKDYEKYRKRIIETRKKILSQWEKQDKKNEEKILEIKENNNE